MLKILNQDKKRNGNFKISVNMKKIISIISLFALFANSCSQEEINSSSPTNSIKFTASFEQNESRTYVEEGSLLRWTAEDQISLFNGTTLNRQFKFDGETGDNAGTFSPVNTPWGTGNDLTTNYAVYPYALTNKISESGVVTATLPAEQSYAENSFGVGDNVMVAVTQDLDDTFLKFNNVCGYLKLQVYGNDVTVKSITLTGNSNEKIAGNATITSAYGGKPTTRMTDAATETITLECGENGVAIGTTAETATDFWMVVPPTRFDSGFTITITDINNKVFTKSTSNKIVVERNVIKPMSAFEVKPIELLSKSVILTNSGTLSQYISNTEKTAITSLSITGPINADDLDFINQMIKKEDGLHYFEGEGNLISLDLKESTIVPGTISLQSNTLTSLVLPNGLTDITVNCPTLTSINIPEGVSFLNLNGCSSLSSIFLPEGLAIIDLSYCSSLKSVTLPNGIDCVKMPYCSSLSSINVPDEIETVCSIEYSGIPSTNYIDLSYCSSLTTVSLPNSVKEIGQNAFANCTSLANLSIPNELEVIGNSAFENCTVLSNIELPNSITNIGQAAFMNCSSLSSITLPSNLTYLGSLTFAGCKKLSSITFNCTLSSIGEYTFAGCSSLTSITLPHGISSIDDYAFTVSGLSTITLPSSITNLGAAVFNNCDALQEIHCKATTPPTTIENTFLTISSDCVIYVPQDCSDVYKQTDFWNFFNDIREE